MLTQVYIGNYGGLFPEVLCLFGFFSVLLSISLPGQLQTVLKDHWASHKVLLSRCTKLSPGAAFLHSLPVPINSQCSSLIVRDIMPVLMFLAVCITQSCSAKAIEITTLCVTRQIWLCLADVPFGSMPVLFLLGEKSLTTALQLLDDAGGCIWATRRRLTRLGITVESQLTSICPGLLQGKGQNEGCMQEIARINAPSNSTNRNRLCRKYKHGDTSGNVHGNFVPATAEHRAILCKQCHLLLS